eukprot:snap_masked-scaffold_1-processed-gene-21.44-mRNA-1 protein AED:1.00 eAED:1.00 QI:0/0/0/0/1/1/2/0/97
MKFGPINEVSVQNKNDTLILVIPGVDRKTTPPMSLPCMFLVIPLRCIYGVYANRKGANILMSNIMECNLLHKNYFFMVRSFSYQLIRQVVTSSNLDD